MSAVLMYAVFAAGGVVVGFGIGWLARSQRNRGRLRESEARWREKVEAVQGQLALERLRSESLLVESQSAHRDTGPVLEFPGQLAQRPARTPDSSVARA